MADVTALPMRARRYITLAIQHLSKADYDGLVRMSQDTMPEVEVGHYGTCSLFVRTEAVFEGLNPTKTNIKLWSELSRRRGLSADFVNLWFEMRDKGYGLIFFTPDGEVVDKYATHDWYKPLQLPESIVSLLPDTGQY